VRAVLVAALLSGLVVVAWVILIVTTPSDPQIGLAYVFTTLYAVLAFGHDLGNRRRDRSPSPSQVVTGTYAVTTVPPA
jgi:hypothetical protein